MDNDYFKDEKERETFFRRWLGEDVFELLKTDVKEAYREILRRYCQQNDIVVGDWDSLTEINELDFRTNVREAWFEKKGEPTTIITEIDDFDFEAKLVRKPVTESRKLLPALLPGLSWKYPTTIIGVRIIKSDEFLLDILCGALYDKKVKLNRYCVLAEDLQVEFEEFRRNGRKRIDEKKKIKMFQDFGYTFPLDALLRVEVAKKTEIEDVVPNIFRFFVWDKKFRKLYEKTRGILEFERDIIQKIWEQEEIKFDDLERYKLEDIVGLNLAIMLSDALSPLLERELQKNIKGKLQKEIKEVIQIIMELPGVYSRIELAKAIKCIINEKKLDSIHDSALKLKRVQKMLRELVDSIVYEYDYMVELMKIFTCKELEERVGELTEKIGIRKVRTLGILKNVEGIETGSIKSSSIERCLYSTIQKEIIQYYL